MIRNAVTFSVSGEPKPLSATARKSPKNAISTAAKSKSFVWIGLEDPDENEMQTLADQLDLHPLATIDAITGKQQPKIQSFDEHLFVVMWMLRESRSKRLNVGSLFLFVREGLLVTVQRDMGKNPLDIEGILQRTETSLKAGAVGGMYGLMANVANTYSDLASDVEDDLEDLEQQVFDSNTTEDGEKVYRLRQQIGKLQRAVSSLAKALETSRDRVSKLAIGNKSLEPYLHDLLDDLAGTAQLVSDQRDSLDGVLSSHESNVASQQTIDTRKISAIAALLSVPAVLAGLAGMNFKNLPGVTWDYGWEAIVVIILAVDGIMFVNFRKKNWL